MRPGSAQKLQRRPASLLVNSPRDKPELRALAGGAGCEERLPVTGYFA